MMEFLDENGRKMSRPYELIDGIDEGTTGNAVIKLQSGRVVNSVQDYEGVKELYYQAREQWFEYLKDHE